jgi:TolB protein
MAGNRGEGLTRGQAVKLAKQQRKPRIGGILPLTATPPAEYCRLRRGGAQIRIARHAVLLSLALTAVIVQPPTPALAAGGGRLYNVAYRLAFETAPEGLFSMNPDGSDVRLILNTSGQTGPWSGLDVSADGSLLVIAHEIDAVSSDMYLMNADGSNFHRLTTGRYDTSPSFSPTGDQIVFNRRAGLIGRNDMYRINTDGTGLTRLTEPGEPSALFPSWSPDGRKIAFVTASFSDKPDRLMVTNPTGTSFHLVRRFPQPGITGSTAWSPYDTASPYDMKILFSDLHPYGPGVTADLWTIRPDGTGLTQVTSTPKRWELGATYSPNGTKIVSTVIGDSEYDADVLTMDADGSNRYRIRTTARLYDGPVAWGRRFSPPAKSLRRGRDVLERHW